MPTYTLADLRTRVYDRLDNNTSLYTTPELDAELNDAIRVVNLLTGFNQASVQVPSFSVTGQYLYSVPAGILFPLEVAFEGRQLQRLSLRKISMNHRDWLTETSSQAKPVKHWVPIGLDKFAIHPADSRGGNDILVTGVAETTVLVNPADTITVADEDMLTVADLAASVLVFKEGGATFAQASLMYQDFIRKMKRKMRWQKMVFPKYFVKVAGSKVKEEVVA